LDGNGAQCVAHDGQRVVEDDYPQSGNASRFKRAGMDSPFITCRRSLADAADLIDRFGDDAGLEAAALAERSRDDGNVARFCHWRHIERVIATLSSDEVQGTVH
jgi:hypothetical protein